MSVPSDSLSESLGRSIWSRLNKKYGAQNLPISIKEEIAAGGTCLIHRVRLENGVSYIEKSLLPKFQGRPDGEKLLEAEFEILSELSHPLIVRPLGLELRPGILGMTKVLLLEEVQGGRLSDLLKGIYDLSDANKKAWAKAFLSQMSSIFRFLQEHQIIYGDLAPENILLQKNGFFKLVDFGVSRKESEDHPFAFRVEGRSLFKAPELLATGGTSRAGDIYALGRIVEEILGPGLSERDPEASRWIQSLTHNREIPTDIDPAAMLRLDKALVPPAHQLVQSGIIRAKTQVQTKDVWYSIDKPIIRMLSVLLLFPFLTTWLPERSTLTVNTLPPSYFSVDGLEGELLFETPMRRLRIKPGDYQVQFVIPSQNNRRLTREVHIAPFQDAKLFEDFRKLDNLKNQ